jgi:hypothetical protein
MDSNRIPHGRREITVEAEVKPPEDLGDRIRLFFWLQCVGRTNSEDDDE